MNTKPLMLTLTSAAVLFCALGTLPVSAQPAVPPLVQTYQPLSDQQLDQLLGPIALYPDPLLGEILPAAAFPTQIVLADRYLASGGDPNSIDQQPWDASVLAVAHYPTVLKYLDDNLAWTTVLGQAFINQQQQVIESIQRLRLSAQNFGNLESTPQQQVVDDNGDVEILPTDPDVIYIPVYLPQYVYYQTGYGPGFGIGCAIGPWLNCDFDWVHHNLRHWDRDHERPANWWHERPDQRQASLASQTTNWHPETHRTVGLPNRNDHGWNTQLPGSPAPAQFQTGSAQARERQQQIQEQLQQRMQQVQQQIQQRNPGVFNGRLPAPVSRPDANNGAFAGNDSSRDTRTFSDRGQQSMGTYTRPEPVQTHVEPPQVHVEAPQPRVEAPEPAPRPAPVAESGGGGGASHDSSRR